METLAQAIKANCCGALLGTGEKARIVKEVARLEKVETTLLREIELLTLELEDVRLEGMAIAKKVFLSMYKGANPEQAWLALCAEHSWEI